MMTYEQIITMLFAQLFAYAVLLHLVMTSLKRQVNELQERLRRITTPQVLEVGDELRERMLKDYETLIKTR